LEVKALQLRGASGMSTIDVVDAIFGIKRLQRFRGVIPKSCKINRYGSLKVEIGEMGMVSLFPGMLPA